MGLFQRRAVALQRDAMDDLAMQIIETQHRLYGPSFLGQLNSLAVGGDFRRACTRINIFINDVREAKEAREITDAETRDILGPLPEFFVKYIYPLNPVGGSYYGGISDFARQYTTPFLSGESL